MTDDTRNDRHHDRMLRKKAVVDQRIAEATTRKGVLLVNTGIGKGKSSAAFGVVARALGSDMKVAVIQFVKNRSDTGEEAFFRRCSDVRWHVMGEGFDIGGVVAVNQIFFCEQVGGRDNDSTDFVQCYNGEPKLVTAFEDCHYDISFFNAQALEIGCRLVGMALHIGKSKFAAFTLIVGP